MTFREPENKETEKAVLGSALIEPSLMNQIAEYGIEPEDFSDHKIALMFERSRQLYRDGVVVDQKELIRDLHKTGLLREVGADNVACISDGLVVRKDATPLLKELVEYSQLRSLATLFSKLTQMTKDPEFSPSGIGHYAMEQIEKITNRGITDSTVFVTNIFDFVVKMQSDMAKRADGETIGLRTGLSSLDRLSKGLFPGEYTIIGGYTGDGKSSMAIQAAMANAVRGATVHVFSVEMTKELMTLRMLPMVTGIPFENLKDFRDLTPHELSLVYGAKKTLNTLPIIIDSATTEIADICARARASVRRYGTQLVVVDYLQIVRAKGSKTRLERVNEVSESLRELAKSLNIHVIALSQLARNENRKKEPPSLFSLKESGQLEQDAFMVWLLYRPEEPRDHYTYEDELNVAKNRTGPRKVLPVVYDEKLLCFRDRSLIK